MIAVIATNVRNSYYVINKKLYKIFTNNLTIY